MTDAEKQALAAEAKATGVPFVEIDITGVQSITLGGSGEILSVTKEGSAPVIVSPLDTSVRN